MAGGYKGIIRLTMTLYGNENNADGKANGMNGRKAVWTVEKRDKETFIPTLFHHSGRKW